MNPDRKRWLVRGVKIVLALVILGFVGWRFQRELEQSDLPPDKRVDLSKIELRPSWLIAAGVLYLVAMFPAAWFWRQLHHRFGYPISLYAAIRAHYCGQLGKYVPGKAMAIAIRAELIHPSGVPYGVSIITSFYEVFTGMASGAMIAAILTMIEPPGELGLGWHPLAIGAVLIGLCGIPLLPGVFNFVIARLTARIQAIELYRLPPVRLGTLAIGLTATSLGWCVQGLSVWAMLQAVLPDPPSLTAATWVQCTAGIAFANVAGFLVVVAPGGLGVREYMLTILLGSFGPGPYITASAILLRLDWIAAEALVAAATYWRKPAPSEPEA
ncbi:MAG: flippase-like domain-containing protein [Planctomycetes bacterium]|nr:flippase-like domain-containing protein [Planctomycetota bacterium]